MPKQSEKLFMGIFQPANTSANAALSLRMLFLSAQDKKYRRVGTLRVGVHVLVADNSRRRQPLSLSAAHLNVK
jgi:hypothetical protein